MPKRSLAHMTRKGEMARLSMAQRVQNTTFEDEQGEYADNEWYTPIWVMRLVRRVLGEIDLDPASSFTANVTVKAKLYYDWESNGLLHPWQGRVFLNPPYGRLNNSTGYVGVFVKKALQEYKRGHISEAILLLPVNATTAYFFSLMGVYPVCIFRRKVNFMRKSGTEEKNMMGTMLVYLGVEREKFLAVFHPYGKIILPEGVINDQEEASTEE